MLSSSRFYNFLFYILIALAGLGLWYNITPSKKKPSYSTNNYDAFANQITSIQFSKIGKKHYQLNSLRINHYKYNNQTRIENPTLYLFNSPKDTWIMTAEYALATHGKEEISFINQVNISGEENSSHEHTQLLTEKISYFPSQNIATTPLPVIIIQPGSSIHSTGMNIDFSNNTINLNSNITGRYIPQH
jgi:LPS export ABC transporter protein LptC